MEVDLKTPVSHPPSLGTCLHSGMAYPPQKYICEYKKIAFFIFLLLKMACFANNVYYIFSIKRS
jgi:hypothetical protein